MKSGSASRVVLALDPGRAKCGVAVVTDREIRFRAIAQLDLLLRRIESWATEFQVTHLVVGNGTNAGHVVEIVQAALPHLPIVVQDEIESTLEARDRYFHANPPRGWRRLIPRSLQVPPEPYDDFAAVVLAERFLSGEPTEEVERA